MRFNWHFGLGRELGYVFWALTLFEAAYGAWATIWPLWIAHLGASITTVGLVLGLGGVIRPFILLGGSWLSDRVDVRMLLVVSRSLLVFGVAFAAFAQTWELLLITVVFYGFGELAFPILHAHIPVHAGGDVVRAFSLTSTIGPSLALIFTPILTSAVIATFGMQGGLLLSAALSALGTLFMTRMDFSEDEAFARASTPATVRDVARDRDTRDIIALHGVTIFALGIGSMLLPNYLRDQRGMSPELITLLASGGAVGTIMFGLSSLRFVTIRRAPFRAAALSAAVAATGFLLIAVTEVLPVIAFAFVLRGGLFATWTFLLTAIGQYAPARLQTRAFAVVEVLGGGALSFAPVAASLLFNVHPDAPLYTAFVLGMVMSGVIVARYLSGMSVSNRPVVKPAP